jgi:hypothetical protein
MVLGIVLIIAGIFFLILGGKTTKRCLEKNNLAVLVMTPQQIKEEQQKVCGTGVVPGWVSLLVLAGWACLIGGLFFIVKSIL